MNKTRMENIFSFYFFWIVCPLRWHLKEKIKQLLKVLLPVDDQTVQPRGKDWLPGDLHISSLFIWSPWSIIHDLNPWSSLLIDHLSLILIIYNRHHICSSQSFTIDHRFIILILIISGGAPIFCHIYSKLPQFSQLVPVYVTFVLLREVCKKNCPF